MSLFPRVFMGSDMAISNFLEMLFTGPSILEGSRASHFKGPIRMCSLRSHPPVCLLYGIIILPSVFGTKVLEKTNLSPLTSVFPKVIVFYGYVFEIYQYSIMSSTP